MRSMTILLAGALMALTGVVHAQSGMTLEQIARLRAVTQAEISPDGRQVAYTLSVQRQPGVDDDGSAWGELTSLTLEPAAATGKLREFGA